MISTVLNIRNKKIFDTIKNKLDPLKYTECGTCGALKVDAEEFEKTLNVLYDEHWLIDFDEVSVEDELLHELWYKMLSLITEVKPTTEIIDDSIIAHEEYIDKIFVRFDPNYLFSELHDKRLRYSPVILLYKEDCDCFRSIKSSSESYDFDLDEFF